MSLYDENTVSSLLLATVNMPNLSYYPSNFLEKMRKPMKKSSQDSQSPPWDLKSGPPEYETRLLTTWMH